MAMLMELAAISTNQQTPYSQWWCDNTLALGLANVFDLQPRHRLETAQHIFEVFEHAILGWVLIINGVLKTTQYHFVRREMMVHVPLLGRNREPATLDVLIAGGGSGDILQEVLQHREVRKVVVLEENPELIEITCEQFGFSKAFADTRVECINASLEDFVASACANYQQFDIILLDLYDNNSVRLSTSASAQFSDAVYKDFNRLLHDESVAVDTSPVMLNKDHEVLSPDPEHSTLRLLEVLAAQGGFVGIQRYYAIDPLLAGGMRVFSLYCKDSHSYALPQHDYTGLHYNPALHTAAFALPTWLKRNQRARQATNAQAANPQTINVGTTDSIWFEQTQGIGISQALPMSLVYREVSPFQEIEFYQHDLFGCVFVLDGTVQGSQADECIYHEMAVHIPVLGRQRSTIRALIIGGGDGGIVRELLKHDAVSDIVMAEIDDKVVASSNRYFAIQGNYEDPRVTLHIGDAAEYVAQAASSGMTFELIIVDATDSTEPSANLWNDTFFENLALCLTDDGVCLDSDILTAGRQTLLSRDLHGEGLRDIKRAKKFFASVESYCSKVPLFPGGYFAFFLYTKDGYSYAVPHREYTGTHYNTALHQAAFALPTWWQQLLDDL